jgi:hypothetical protein
LNYLFLASHDIHHKPVMLSLSGLANCAAAPRLDRRDLRQVSARLVAWPVPAFAVPFSSRVPVVRQLLDVVHQAVELPLRIDLGLPSQGEAVQFLVRSEVAEHRFHGGEAR